MITRSTNGRGRRSYGSRKNDCEVELSVKQVKLERVWAEEATHQTSPFQPNNRAAPNVNLFGWRSIAGKIALTRRGIIIINDLYLNWCISLVFDGEIGVVAGMCAVINSGIKQLATRSEKNICE
ncbi:hypothetical protein Hanom_Chr07g00678401 [Helianthus anomalus]